MGVVEWLGIAGFTLGVINTAYMIYGLRTGLHVAVEDQEGRHGEVGTDPFDNFYGAGAQKTPCVAFRMRLVVSNRTMRTNTVTSVKTTHNDLALAPIEADSPVHVGTQVNEAVRQLGLGDERAVQAFTWGRIHPDISEVIPAKLGPGEQVEAWITGWLPEHKVTGDDHVHLRVTLKDAAGNGRTKHVKLLRSSILQTCSPEAPV